MGASMRFRGPAEKWNQQGSVAVITAAGLLMLLGMAGLALDLGHLYVVKSELQRAADAGARAGAAALFFPATSSPPQCSQATTAGATIARANPVDKDTPVINHIQTGRWNWTASTFTQGCSSGSSTFTNAVSITVSKADVSLALMGIFGLGPVTLTANSTAVMDFVGRVPTGTIPVGASQNSYQIGQKVDLRFSSTGNQNGGWVVPSGYSASAANLKNFINQTPPMQALKAGDAMNLNNGNVAAALSALKTKLAANGNNWTVYLPVFNRALTTPWNGSDQIDGFMAFTITAINSTGNPKYIRGTVTNMTQASINYGPTGANLNLLAPVKVVD